MHRTGIVCAALAIACGAGSTARTRAPRIDARPGLQILALPGGHALIQDRREVVLAAGRNELRVEGVPRLLRESSVTLRSFTDPDGTRVRAQRFDFDARDAVKALDRHVGAGLVVVTDAGEVAGTLVAHDVATITVDTGAVGEGRIRVVPTGESLRAVRLGDHEGGWLVSPTIVWEVEARRAGAHLVEIVYESAGLTWRADHVVVLGEGVPSVSTWITVANQTGRSFEGATLELVEEQGAWGGQMYGAYGGDLYGAAYGGPFVELEPAEPRYDARAHLVGGRLVVAQSRRADADYELYPVPWPVTLVDGATTQIAVPAGRSPGSRVDHRLEMLPESAIFHQGCNRDPPYGAALVRSSATRELVIDRDRAAPALPAGTVRLLEGDEATGALRLVAETHTKRVAPGEPLRLPLGGAPDVLGMRVRKRFSSSERGRTFRESFEISVDNRGSQPAEVRLIEHLVRCPRWELRDASSPREEAGSRTVSFPLTVGAGKRATVSYQVVYKW